MTEVFELIKDQLLKMEKDKSWVAGILSSVILAVPKWVLKKEIGIEHAVLIVILVVILSMDYLAGSTLAKKSPVKRKNSTTLFECIVRDFTIIAICVLGYLFDYLLGTGSIILTAITVAFAYQNLYSFMANVAVLKWEEKFPLWLFKWLQDEIEAKKEKYFPERKGDDNV